MGNAGEIACDFKVVLLELQWAPASPGGLGAPFQALYQHQDFSWRPSNRKSAATPCFVLMHFTLLHLTGAFFFFRNWKQKDYNAHVIFISFKDYKDSSFIQQSETKPEYAWGVPVSPAPHHRIQRTTFIKKKTDLVNIFTFSDFGNIETILYSISIGSYITILMSWLKIMIPIAQYFILLVYII